MKVWEKLFSISTKYGEKMYQRENMNFWIRITYLVSGLMLSSSVILRKKVSVFGVIRVCNFPHSDWIRGDTKIRTRITPNTDTFHSVCFCNDHVIFRSNQCTFDWKSMRLRTFNEFACHCVCSELLDLSLEVGRLGEVTDQYPNESERVDPNRLWRG